MLEFSAFQCRVEIFGFTGAVSAISLLLHCSPHSWTKAQLYKPKNTVKGWIKQGGLSDTLTTVGTYEDKGALKEKSNHPSLPPNLVTTWRTFFPLSKLPIPVPHNWKTFVFQEGQSPAQPSPPLPPFLCFFYFLVLLLLASLSTDDQLGSFKLCFTLPTTPPLVFHSSTTYSRLQNNYLSSKTLEDGTFYLKRQTFR